MKTLNAKKRQVGYLIRRDEKESWVQDQMKKHPNVLYLHRGAEYLQPSYPIVLDPESIRLGWEHLSDCQLHLSNHIQEAIRHGYDPCTQFDYSIVKVVINEMKVQDGTI